MRVALATSSYEPYKGGVEEHVRNVARVLREEGHEVVVWTVDRAGGHGIRQVDGIEVHDLPAPLPARTARAMARLALRGPAARRRWRAAAESFRPDVIHVHCFGPNGGYARRVARALGIPLVFTAHGETLADDTGLFSHSRFAMGGLTRILADADAVTGCSQLTLDDLTARFGLPAGAGTVVFNGIDAEEAVGESPVEAAGPYIAAIGRVERLKGFDLLVAAFAEAQLPPEVSLVIGGGGPELPALRAQAEALGVGDRVILPGWLERPAVGAVRAGALVGVVPSRIEPFGIAALEVWRAGSALVATTRGGPPEFVDDGVDGLLIDPEDVAALAGALSRLVADPLLARRLAEAGAVRVGAFTWERVVSAYEGVYGEVVAQADTAATDIT